MAGFKDFANLTTLDADDIDGYLMGQTIMRFSSDTALVTNLGAGVRTGGMYAWSDASSTLYSYEGSGIWKPQESFWKTQNATLSAPTVIPIGNGSLTCRWRYSGGKVVAEYGFVRGSTTGAGSAGYFINLPVEAYSLNGPKGYGILRRSGGAEHGLLVVPVSSTSIALMTTNNNARVAFNAPAAVATGDTYTWQVIYEPLNGIS
ncbi:hypothetical protein [Kribbella sp. DT2]|uniref:hypothetical protein n=1 Tax=Kribbella sp. DT2 TaxID=3393427 RepID=UPI003CE67B09